MSKPGPTPNDLSASHFDSIAHLYQASPGLEPLYRSILPHLNEWTRGRSVLDVGNGGVFPYDIACAGPVTVLDISAEMLNRVRSPEITKVVGDARDMAAFPDGCFETVLFNLSLHHIEADTFASTRAGIRRVLASSFRVLRPGGRLILYEPLLRPALFLFQRAFFQPIRRALAAFGAPMVCFQTLGDLRADVCAAFGVAPSDVEVIVPSLEGRVNPVGGLFPNGLAIPIGLFPTRFHLLSVVKRPG